uniref:A kinase (PRKA) anchor protein 12b n=1 Tax=Salarias fasciatus TaxID=181472 RepID=A0A672IAN5_SALFA
GLNCNGIPIKNSANTFCFTYLIIFGQPDGVSVAQKEDASETMDTIQDEVAPQVNGEKGEKESADANDITAVEEKAAEEKPSDANEVGFKKIFRFVGFKFTLKKDKSEEKDPVKLLTVKDKEGEEVSGTDEPVKEEEAATPEEKSTTEEKEADTEASTAEADATKDTEKDETTDAPVEGAAAEASDESAKEEGDETKEAKEDETTPPSQEATLSPFRKKKASIKKTKEELEKEAAAEEEAAKTSEDAVEEKEEKEEKETTEQETKEEAPETPAEETSEPKEEASTSPVEEKSEAAPETEASVEAPAPTEETKQDDQKAEDSVEEEKAPAEVTSEAELLSSQEKTKAQGSPLKKLFTGAGLKKLSTKKQKAKKETEPKPAESGEQAAEQLQSSTETAEPPKADSGPSSPEESGEHVIAVEVTQNESSQEAEGEVVSDGEKKKEGIIAWSSFKKLVTPKKRVKRPSESEDEAAAEKPGKSATLSSSESAALTDKSVEEEAKEEKPSEEEPKTENTEKLVSSTEEPKRKMDTSVSWEALMCMGGPKKRTRKTSDSDDEETKIEEDMPAAAEGEQEVKTEATIVTSQNTESEGEAVSSPEPLSPPERESTWDTLKRMVMPRSKSKGDEKLEDSTEQVQSDSEVQKDESTFSLRKLFPGRRKKKVEKQSSTEQCSGEEDSDTPAVVPLSEYDQQEDSEPEAIATPPEVQIKVSTVSAEDRSPSWIPATVEDPDEKQLSDIPEEAENAATPKSIDTDIADDEAEEDRAAFLKAAGRTGRRLSTAEVKPVAPAPDAATTPVPKGPASESATEVVEGIEAQISEIPTQASVTVQDVAAEEASEQTEYEPPTDSATAVAQTILQPHARNEAMAICTGLGTKEIAKVALEKPVLPVVESVTVIRDALSSEVSVEEKPSNTEEATLGGDELLQSQTNQVDTTYLEAPVDSSESDAVGLETATEGVEPDIEKVGAVSTAVEESEVIQPPAVTENSPTSLIVSPITPTCEELVCIQSVEISELTVDTKEVNMEMEQLAAVEENIPVKEVIQVVTEEMAPTFHGVHSEQSTISEEAEPINLADADTPVIKETVVLVAPPTAESDQADTSDMDAKKESAPEPVDAEQVQVQETKEEDAVAEAEEHTTASADSETSGIKEQVSEKVEEVKEEVQQAGEIETQSMAIAQSVIQDAVDKISEDKPEEQKPATPTTTFPGETRAVSTTEEEIDVSTFIVTETPVPVVCEKPAPPSPQSLFAAIEVTDAIPLEVTESLDEEKEEKEEKKPKKGVKEAVEVKVSEETVIVEEVVEIIAESQTDEEPDQIKEEESKEDQKPSEEHQPEETKSEASAKESSPKALEIHMPVQVVLQTAQVLEEPSVEEEAAEEFGSNGAPDTTKPAETPARQSKLSVLLEEPQPSDSAEDGAPSETTDAAETEKAPSAKCAEVMAQVIEVIEEAVKEIEPVSTEITAAS